MAMQSWKKKIGYPHWNGYGNLTLLGAEHTVEHIISSEHSNPEAKPSRTHLPG